jgi:hypothetical protein
MPSDPAEARARAIALKSRAHALVRGLQSGAYKPGSSQPLAGYKLVEAREAAERRSRRARELVPVAASRFIQAGQRRAKAKESARDAAELWRDVAQNRARERRYAMRQKW